MKAYAAYSLESNIIMNSSSGGICTLIANEILSKGGVVYGATLNEDLQVVHIRVDNNKDINRIRGSKYVQSLVEDTYIKAKKDLENGRYVLYTGTPCQIAGLKKFLVQDYERLYTQDLVCHGIPTIIVWKKYKEYLKNKYESKLINIEFRNKSKGWELFQIKLEFESGKVVYENFRDNIYMKAFLKNICLRESCYKCKYKTIDRVSDITLADFWGIKNVCPEMYNKNGTSLVMIQSKKGQEIFDLILKKIKYKEVNINEVLKYNSAMIKSVPVNENKEKFFKILEIKDFKKAIDICIPKERRITRIIRKFKGMVKALLLKIKK